MRFSGAVVARLTISFLAAFSVIGMCVGSFAYIAHQSSVAHAAKELSSRSREFIAHQKETGTSQVWETVNVEATPQVAGLTTYETSCFRFHLDVPSMYVHVRPAPGCVVEARLSAPIGRLTIGLSEQKNGLDEDGSVLLRRRDPQYTELQPIKNKLIFTSSHDITMFEVRSKKLL